MENKKLEEAAAEYAGTLDSCYTNDSYGFKSGALWQQEQNKELLQQRDELAKALKDMLSRFEHCEEGMIKADHVKEQARIAISKINP